MINDYGTGYQLSLKHSISFPYFVSLIIILKRNEKNTKAVISRPIIRFVRPKYAFDF